mmetsp:Transcript_3219/g.9906  ORF Transcript_3219/g.9906 Transcript_3219/m.9906 type:complete len:221 (-) Transcript_3219:1295-1957(-)
MTDATARKWRKRLYVSLQKRLLCTLGFHVRRDFLLENEMMFPNWIIFPPKRPRAPRLKRLATLAESRGFGACAARFAMSRTGAGGCIGSRSVRARAESISSFPRRACELLLDGPVPRPVRLAVVPQAPAQRPRADEDREQDREDDRPEGVLVDDVVDQALEASEQRDLACSNQWRQVNLAEERRPAREVSRSRPRRPWRSRRGGSFASRASGGAPSSGRP